MAEVSGLFYRFGLNYDKTPAEQMKRDIIAIDKMARSIGNNGGRQSLNAGSLIGDMSSLRTGASSVRSLTKALKQFDSRDNSAALSRIRREASAVGNLSSAYKDAARNLRQFSAVHSKLFSNSSMSNSSRIVRSLRSINRETENSTRRNTQNLNRLGMGAQTMTRSLSFMRSTMGALGIPLAAIAGAGAAVGAGVAAVISRSETVRETQNQSALIGVTPQQQRSTDYQFRAMGANEGSGVQSLRNVREFQRARSQGQIDPSMASSFAIAGMPSIAGMIKPGQNPMEALDDFRREGHKAWSRAGDNDIQKQNVINALSPIFGDATQAVISRPDEEWNKARADADKNAPMDQAQEKASRDLTAATTNLSEAFDKLQGQLLVGFAPLLTKIINETSNAIDSDKRDSTEKQWEQFDNGSILMAMLRDGEKKPYSDEDLQRAKEKGRPETVKYYERNKYLNDMFDKAQAAHPELVGNASSFWAGRGRWLTKDRSDSTPEEHEQWLKTPAGMKYQEYDDDVKRQEKSNAARKSMGNEYFEAYNDKTGVKMDEWRAKWMGATEPREDTQRPIGSAKSYTPAPIPVSKDMSVDDMHRVSIYKESRGSDTWQYDDPNGKFKKGDWMKSDAGAMYSRQVLPSVAHDPTLKQRLNIEPAKDDSPEESNRVGDELLDALYKRYHGDAEKALAAYHSGEGNVDRAARIAEKNGLDWRGGLGDKGRGYIDYTGSSWKPSEYESKRGVDQSSYAPISDPSQQQGRQTTMNSPTINMHFNGVSGSDADMIESKIRTVVNEVTAQQNFNSTAQLGGGLA